MEHTQQLPKDDPDEGFGGGSRRTHLRLSLSGPMGQIHFEMRKRTTEMILLTLQGG